MENKSILDRVAEAWPTLELSDTDKEALRIAAELAGPLALASTEALVCRALGIPPRLFAQSEEDGQAIPPPR
jgi:hypothetical protein